MSCHEYPVANVRFQKNPGNCLCGKSRARDVRVYHTQIFARAYYFRVVYTAFKCLARAVWYCYL